MSFQSIFFHTNLKEMIPARNFNRSFLRAFSLCKLKHIQIFLKYINRIFEPTFQILFITQKDFLERLTQVFSR